MPFLVAVQLVWDSLELGNLQKKNVTLQINDKSVLKNMLCLQTSPSPPHLFLKSLKYTMYGSQGTYVQRDFLTFKGNSS